MDFLLLDNFVGTNGTHLAAHSPDVGGPWIDDVAGWEIESNQAAETVASCISHVETAAKFVVAEMTFNLNGGLASSLLTLGLIDDTGHNGLLAYINGDGSFGALINVGNQDTIEVDTYVPPAVLDLHADHFLQANFGPDRIRVSIDGSLYFSSPRYLAKTFAIQRTQLKAAVAVGAGSPTVKRLQVAMS